jgi:SAM-dependent methyltransferase
VVRCGACRLRYLHPRLEESAMLASYREQSYFEGAGLGYRSYGAQEKTLRATFSRLLRDMERRGATGGRLLEVGCAYGFFLDEARGRFDHRTGTDFSQAALARAQGRADSLVVGGIPELPPQARYDVAACIHVIEHVYDPVAFTRQIVERLRPGGSLLLAAPDAGSLWLPFLGSRWPFFKVPEHVSYFDTATLRTLLESAGCIDVRPIPYVSWFHLDLVGEKLGLPIPGPVRRWRVRMPGTTVALLGRKPE